MTWENETDYIENKIDKLLDEIKEKKRRGEYMGDLWVKVLRLQDERDRILHKEKDSHD